MATPLSDLRLRAMFAIKAGHSPQEVMRRLGLDASLLDNHEGNTMVTAVEALQSLKQAILQMSPQEQNALLAGLQEIVNSGDAEQFANAEPVNGGGSAMARAEDRQRMAADAAFSRRVASIPRSVSDRITLQDRSEVDFSRRFPNASRIG